jgi:hypothetical protein
MRWRTWRFHENLLNCGFVFPKSWAARGGGDFEPTMRAHFAQTVPQAWAAASVEQISFTAKPTRWRPVTA